jgi:hypothetical protein
MALFRIAARFGDDVKRIYPGELMPPRRLRRTG